MGCSCVMGIVYSMKKNYDDLHGFVLDNMLFSDTWFPMETYFDLGL